MASTASSHCRRAGDRRAQGAVSPQLQRAHRMRGACRPGGVYLVATDGWVSPNVAMRGAGLRDLGSVNAMSSLWLRTRLPVMAAVTLLVASACSPAPSATTGPAATGPAATTGAGATTAPTTAAAVPKKGGSITVAIEGEPASMDPAFDYDFVSGLAVSSVTEGLLKFCENDTKLCPNLAESYT